jgi:sigma-E factor negative regulatory protein RseC
MADQAKVIQVKNNHLVLELVRDKPCMLCGQTAGCGNSLWGKLLNHEDKKITVENNIGAKEGDIVNLEMNEKDILKSALIIYLIPLLFFLVLLACAQYFLENNFLILLIGIAGLFLGIIAARKLVDFMKISLKIKVN